MTTKSENEGLGKVVHACNPSNVNHVSLMISGQKYEALPKKHIKSKRTGMWLW
jgi:hypothetical protein